MLILILGANNLCTDLANALIKQGHDICIVSENSKLLEHLQQFIDCQTIIGCPSHPHVLRSANAEKADMLIAATGNDEMNMIACQVAYSLFKVKRKIAFISNAHYWDRHELFGNDNLPIDTIISLDNVIADQLSELITFSSGFLYDSFVKSSLNVGISTINLLDFEDKCSQDFRILAIFRGNQLINLDHDTYATGDKILFTCLNDMMESNINYIYGTQKPINKVMLSAPAGVIDAFCNRHQDYNLKVIMPSISDCQALANQHPNATMLNGHITEHELLASENMKKIEYFCAITKDDEDNIMAALQAKELGANKTIAMVNKKHYQTMLSNSTIDYILDPTQKVLEQVLAHISHPWVKNIHQIPKTNFQLIELQNTRNLDAKELSQLNVVACIHADTFVCTGSNIPKNSIILILENANASNTQAKLRKIL